MPIYPLPQFEDDLKQLEEEDRKVYEALAVPKTLVVRFGSMKMVGEFPYDGSVKPGCGSKVIVKTHRGTEMGEMLTSTCPNSGCGKSVSRQEMLRYIENSGGRDYPFFTDGRVLRIATREDMDGQARIEQQKHGMKLEARGLVEPLNLPLKIVEVEPVLGGERLTVHYISEDRVDLSGVFRVLQQRFGGRLDIKHVGPRDEARIAADYEKCGQYCCCKNFLKVLKPISMKSAKVQKATLDPLKISGRCGRLMCCLRYEDETYDELKKKLPHKKTRVGTPEGDGYVVDSQILTQLVLVHLDYPQADGKTQRIAVPVEDLTPPKSATPPPPAPMEQFGPRVPRGAGGPGGGGGMPPRRDGRGAGQGAVPGGGARIAEPPGAQGGTGTGDAARGGTTARAGERRADRPDDRRAGHERTPPRPSAPGGQPSASGDDLDEIMRGLDEDEPRSDRGPRAPQQDSGRGPDGPGGAGGQGGPGGGRRRRRRRGGRGGSGRGPGGPTSQPPGGAPPG